MVTLLIVGAALARPAVPLWAVALTTTLGMQINASLLDQSLAVVAPLLTTGLGVAPERIGNLSSLSSLGVVTFLLFGGPVLARLGPVRMLQVGALISICGLLLVTSGSWPLIACAAFLLGLGYGPSPPAGSRILARTAPLRHRTLIFSVKQAGAPVGGALAALVLAPVAAYGGWEAALALAIGIGLVAAIVIEPTRKRLDDEKRPEQRLGLRTLFSPRAVAAPFAMLLSTPALLRIACLAFSFAILQGSLFSFSVTYLTLVHGLSLPQAGAAYAGLLAAGSVARIALGWLADRTGTPALNLTVQAVVAAVLALAYGALPAPAPFWLALLSASAVGFVAVSWNGIFMAEIARLAPDDKIAEATAASTLVAFLGYVSGPTIFSLIVSYSGSYRAAFAFAAAQLMAAALYQLWRLLTRRAAQG